MSDHRPYPWQTKAWQQVVNALQLQRLPHAWLLEGPRGTGKRHFAQLLVAGRLCEQPTPDALPCGECRACHLVELGHHPDHLVIEPEEKSLQLLKGQIDRVVDFMALKANMDGFKTTILDPADLMAKSPANALLKVLEEPPPQSLLILVSHQSGPLLPTLRSRCRKISFTEPAAGIARQWLTAQLPAGTGSSPDVLLALAHGAPLTALALADSDALAQRQALLTDLTDLGAGRNNPVDAAATWDKTGAVRVLGWIAGILEDLIRYRADSNPPYRSNPDLGAQLQPLSERLDLQKTYKVLDKTREALQLASGFSTVNDLGLLEDVAIMWMALTDTATQN